MAKMTNRINTMGTDGAVTMSSVDGLVGAGFASRYQIQPKVGF